MAPHIEFLAREELSLRPETEKEFSEICCRAAQTCIHIFSQEERGLCIVLGSEAEIQQLNNQWRSIDRATDVLSFAADEGENLYSPLKSTPLGDIFISLARAQAQAEEYGHSLERELAFLTVHGTLHLLGYDHMNPDDEGEMRQAQNVVMEALELGI